MTTTVIIYTRCSQPITGAECTNCGFIGERTGWPPKPRLIHRFLVYAITILAMNALGYALGFLIGWAIARYCCE